MVVSTFDIGAFVLRSTTSIPKPTSDQAIWEWIQNWRWLCCLKWQAIYLY